MSTEYANLGFRVDSGGLLTADQRLKIVTNSGRATDAQVTTLNKTFSGLTSTLGLATTALGLIGAGMSVKGVIDYSDAWSNVNSQLRQVTNSEQDLISTRSQLLKITKETRSELTNTVDLYATMTRSTKDLNISSERLMDVTKTLNNLFVSGGKPISEVEGAIRQLNQGLAAGALRGDEFNSVAEGAPKVMDALAVKLQMTRGELRSFAATGGITSEILISALEDYQVTAQKLADQTAKTFGQNLQNATTNVTEFVGNSESLNSAVGSLGGGIESLSENLDALADAGKGVGAVLVAAATPAVYAYSVSLASAAKAQLLAGTTAVRTVNALGQVTVAAGTATVATNGLAIASRFLLGPWGLLIAAVTAGASMFISAKNDSDNLAMSLDEQAAKLARLNSVYRDMAKSDLESERNKLLERSNEILFERLDIEEKIQKLSANSTIQMGMETVVDPQVLEEINQLEDALESLARESEKIDEPLTVIIQTLKDLHPALGQSTASTELAERANQKAAQSYAEMVKNLENERQQLILTSDEFEIYMVRQQASANQWTPAMTAQIIDQTRALQDQRAAIETVNAQLDNMMSGDLFGFGGDSVTQELSGDLESLTNQVDNFGGAWTRTGNVIADSMGDAVSILDDFASKMQSIEKLQGDLTAERKEYADGTKEAIKIDESLAKLQDESLKAYIGGLGSSMGLASKMFAENSKERKALHAVEMSLSAIELAMTLKTTVANAAAGAAKFFAQSGWAGFAGVAAMGAVLASFGLSIGGGGGGGYEAPQDGGTGTTLGDSSAQSASINNSLENFEDIQIDQLAELKDISNAMTGLAGGIENLAASFARNLDFTDSGYSGELGTIKSSKNSPLMKVGEIAANSSGLTNWLYKQIGDPLFDAIVGGFSKTKKKLVDSGIDFLTQSFGEIIGSGELSANMYQVIETEKKKFWGLSSSSSTNTELTSIESSIAKQMADVFGYIGDAVISASNFLWGDEFTEQILKTFQIEIPDVSFLDKTGEEIQEELEAIFSQQADLMTSYVFPQLEEYQKINEGLFETLQRVAYEQAVFNDSLERTGMSLSSLSNIMQIDVAQSIISLTGGLEQFSELSNSFFESFFSESEQLAYLEKSLTEAFSGLGLSIVDSRESFKDLLTGIDITTAAGQELYSSLLQLVPSMDSYLSALEKEEEEKEQARIRLLEEEEERKQARVRFLESEKSLINSSINSLSSLISNINNELGQAYTVQEALAAARRGDFEIAKKMTGQRVSVSDFSDSIAYARAKAIEDNKLFEIGSLASAEKSDLERQVELLDKQIEAIENGTDDQVSAILDLGEIVNNGNNDIIRAIMTPSSGGSSNLMNDIPSTSNSMGKSMEESRQQSANAIQQVELMNREVVKNTKTTAKILQKIELNGVRVLQ